jgi:pimeloyl-ACP methyl ester carboxylesterase
MLSRTLVVVAAAAALSSCGGSSDSNDSVTTIPQANVSAPGTQQARATPQGTAAKSRSSKAGGSTTIGSGPSQDGSYLHPFTPAKTSNGKTPAVVLVPESGNKSGASAEAERLAALGVAAMVVASPADAPKDPAAFNRAVAAASRAVGELRRRPGIDPYRVGMIGEGVGAHIAAVAIGRKPGSVSAAVLADIGGVVVPSRRFAPERWLARARETDVMFQRDLGQRAMTSGEIRRLLLAAPPGTLVQNYKDLGVAAQTARDRWLKARLIVG